ncbi:hypothetical protein JQX58_06555 [Marinomonas ostreistagni]|nr:hypothetical protein [Marinomonas ostreistagni]
MSPTLHHGDYVITRTCLLNLHAGDVVVVQHPQFDIIIKRIAAILPHGLTLQGDNLAASTSSERMGLVSHARVLGKVIKCVST